MRDAHIDGYNILMVEDNLADQELIQQHLPNNGYRWHLNKVQSGEDGLTALAHHQTFDCILLDYQLPDMNGEEFLAKLQERSSNPPPVIVLTGAMPHSFGVNIIHVGAQDYLTKDKLDIISLKATIRHAIERHQLITQLKSSEEKLLVSNRQLIEEMKRRETLQAQLVQSQKMEVVGTLAGGLAHDFNNILFGIKGSNTVIKTLLPRLNADENVTQKLDGLTENVNVSVERARNIIERLLTFSRKPKLDIIPMQVGDIIQEVLTLSESSFPKDITLSHTSLSPECWVKAEATALEQSLLNLLINAKDAIPGSGTISIKDFRVSGDDSANPLPCEALCIAITDSGVGIAEDIRSQIFDPFFTTKSVNKGTGLGLSMVYRMIQHLEGEVTVSSKVGLGSTFNLFLPLIDEPSIKNVPAIPADDIPSTPEESLRILLVDDENLIRENMTIIFDTLGHSLHCVENGQQAVEHYIANTTDYDVIIMDLSMPVMDGEEAINLILERHPDAPIILSSGNLYDDRAKRLIQQRDIPILPKPYNIDTLLAAIAPFKSRS